MPSWKVIAAHETLVAVLEARYFRRDQLDGCLGDANAEAGARGRAVLLLRDQWKNGGYPVSGVDVVRAVRFSLEPFYRAIGAVEILQMLVAEVENPF